MTTRDAGRTAIADALQLGGCSYTLVWIDSERAQIVRWSEGPSVVELLSDVPVHRRSTGRVPIDPWTGRGAGKAQATVEAQRRERLGRFLTQVADRLDDVGPVEILGPGAVRDHLRRLVVDGDARHGRRRPVTSTPSAPMTMRQLVALLRVRVGAEPPRQIVRPTG